MGTPGSRFYLVNDRPVAVVPTWDGGEDCVAFDFATGELLPDRSYFRYLIPGSGKDVDVVTQTEFAAQLAVYRAEAGARAVTELRQWAERLCLTAGQAADLGSALGPFKRDRGDDVRLELPPGGYSRISITVDKQRTGRVRIELRPAGRLLTREILDAEFHAERELPIPPDSWLEGFVTYEDVTVPGTPAACEIDAQFRNQAAVRIQLSRDPRN
jgi:hypothetical protein